MPHKKKSHLMNPLRFVTATLLLLFGVLLLWNGSASLAQTKPAPVFDASFLASLKGRNPSVRQAEVRSLKAVRPVTSEVVAAFNRALQDESEDVRGEAVYGLSEIGAGEAAHVVSALRLELQGTVPMLLKVLTNKAETQHVRFNVPVALGRMKPASADTIAALVQVGKDTGDRLTIRERALSALGNLGPEAAGAIPALQKLATDDKSELVQIRAWEALAQIQPGNPKAMEVLVEVVQGKRGKTIEVREEGISASVVVIGAIETLIKIKAVKEVLPLLIEVVKNTYDKGGSSEVGFTAANLLGDLGPAAKPTIPALIEILRAPSKTQEDDGLKYFVIGALYRIDPTSKQINEAFADIAAHDPNLELRKAAAAYLTGMPTQKEQPSSR